MVLPQQSVKAYTVFRDVPEDARGEEGGRRGGVNGKGGG
jgi:hypothetical protein